MKIEKNGMIVEDTMDKIIETQDGITCGCKNPQLRGISFIDGEDFYSNTYECICGNAINVRGKR